MLRGLFIWIITRWYFSFFEHVFSMEYPLYFFQKLAVASLAISESGNDKEDYFFLHPEAGNNRSLGDLFDHCHKCFYKQN